MRGWRGCGAHRVKRVKMSSAAGPAAAVGRFAACSASARFSVAELRLRSIGGTPAVQRVDGSAREAAPRRRAARLSVYSYSVPCARRDESAYH